jgi:hypothetical protein
VSKISYKFLTILLIATILQAGCTKSQKEYVSLAEAGTAYSKALDNLLVATQTIAIDANSERLLQDDLTSNQTIEQYRNLSDQDVELIKTISQLRSHVKLLSRYFELLLELANSDAPQRAQTAIGGENSGLIGNLNSLSKELRGSSLLSGGVASALGPITNFAVNSLVRKALKDELKARQEMIRSELLLQEDLLKVLSKRITRDSKIIQQTRELRLVIEPLISDKPIGNPDGWIVSRRTVLTLEVTSSQLKTASDSVKKLREAFEDFTSGKLTLARIDSLLSDFQTLLEISEKLKN